MRPSRRLLQLLLAWLLLGLLATVLRLPGSGYALHANLLFWAAGAIILMVTSVDGFLCRRPPALRVSRQVDPYLALGVSQRVGLRIGNEDGRSLSLQVTDTPAPQLQFEGLPRTIGLTGGEYCEIHYPVIPTRRGLARFDRVCCRILSPWGLWERKFNYCEPEAVKVYPNYRPLFQSTFVNSEQLFSDWGIRLRQRRGEGTDFHQLRDFRIGDSLRQVDWRATARFHRPISREYQEERDQQVIFLLDCGRRMRAREGGISHFDHALNALLLSAFIALRQGDSVGLLSFAGDTRWVAPLKGRHQISQLLDRIYDLGSTLDTSDYLEAAQQLIGRQTRRSLVILISSIEPEDRDDLRQAVRLLSRHHLVLIASMRQQALIDARQKDIGSLEDALRYCGASQHHLRQALLHSELRASRSLVTDTRPSLMHVALVDEYMALKRAGVF